MVNITLSISEDVYKEMKRHPEIKWSEVARRSIIEKTKLLKGSIHSRDLLKQLSPKTRKNIERVPEKKWREFAKKMREASRKS